MKLSINKVIASILTVTCVAASSILPAGATEQTKTTYNTTIDGGNCSIKVTTDTSNDTTTSISDSENQHIQVVRNDDNYTITTINKDENGNLMPETKQVQTIVLDNSSDSSSLTNSLNSSLRSSSFIANGGSRYWTGDYWYIYVNNEWHIYYGKSLVNTGRNSSSKIVKRCNAFKSEMSEADDKFEDTLNDLYGDIPEFGTYYSVAKLVINIADGTVTGTQAIETLLGALPGVGVISNMAVTSADIGLCAAHHRNYHQAWMDVRDMI